MTTQNTNQDQPNEAATSTSAAPQNETSAQPNEAATPTSAAPQDASAQPNEAATPTSAAPQDTSAQPKAESAKKAVSLQKGNQTQPNNNDIAKQHEAIQKLFGLKRSYEQRADSLKDQAPPTSTKSIVVIIVACLLISGAVVAYVVANDLIEQKRQAEVEAKKQREIDADIARQNRIEFAEIAFLDSLPEQISISMDGKKLYAKTEDGSFTELRAGKNTWIRYLPVKESTVIKFSFEAEGFNPLTRDVNYGDWYPAHKGDITLQKIFKKIVMSPDVTPRIASCQGDDCEWSVFREIMFRTKYAEVAKMAVINDADKDINRLRVLKTHPSLAAAIGIDPNNMPKTEVGLSQAAQNALQFIDKHPFGLYGQITIESNAPDTKITFLGEPLMLFKESGSMSQVRVDPGAPFSFSTYGQGHPITITEPLSIRLEAQGYPSYVAEILPHQWHCTPLSDELLASMQPPAFTQIEDTKADYKHYACDYSIRLKVDFEAIKAAAEQKADPETAEATKPTDPQKAEPKPAETPTKA